MLAERWMGRLRVRRDHRDLLPVTVAGTVALQAVKRKT
jgi:hypothetical protein